MFSSRTGWNLSPNALQRCLDEMRNNGETILDLTESNPTRCGFTYDTALVEVLASERSLKYEPDPRGLLAARKSIAGYYEEHGSVVDPSNIFITAGTSEAYSHLFRLLCNAGENVLVPKPSYPLFDFLCTLNDVEARYYRLRYTDEWQIDIGSLNDAVDESTRAILLVHPNNPTGSFVKTGEWEELKKIARDRRLALIVDEVFAEFSFEDTRNVHRSFAGDGPPFVFTLNGISKMLGLPQMKLAWITVSGQAGDVKDAAQRLEIICDTYLSAGTPVQHALPMLLREGRSVRDEIRQRIVSNRNALQSMTHGSPLSLLNTEGGWNAIVKFPRLMSDEAWALRVLKESNVLVHPGHFFEIEEEACTVVSLLPEESTFSSGFHKTLRLVHTILNARESA